MLDLYSYIKLQDPASPHQSRVTDSGAQSGHLKLNHPMHYLQDSHIRQGIMTFQNKLLCLCCGPGVCPFCPCDGILLEVNNLSP